jgi:hypothetical protein
MEKMKALLRWDDRSAFHAGLRLLTGSIDTDQGHCG